jgi:SPP1 gp7 family putative phage head morphogenesis protein
MNDTIRAALVTLIRSNRRKMSRAQRRRGIKPQRWLYPWATERHYAALIRAWLRPVKDYVHKYLRENQESILRGDSAGFTVDNADNITVSRMDAVPGKSFKKMIDSLNGWLGQYVPDDDESKSGSPVYMGLGRIADSAFDFNEGQFEKGAKSVLGVEFPVGEDWWPFARDIWANQNYDLIRSDMRKYISDINGLTEKAVTSGWSIKELTKQIQELDEKITKARAEFIARDQTGKLNGQITQRRMESVGLTMYIWETSGDERVRPSHEIMDDRLCRWDDSTVCSEDGGKTWMPRPSGAVQLHPGFDWQCRCCATSYWEELVQEADRALDYEGPGTVEEEARRGLENYKAEAKRRAVEAAAKRAKKAAGKKDYKPVDKTAFKGWEKDADDLFDNLTANQERALKMYSASGFESMNRIQYDDAYAKTLPKDTLSEIKKRNKDAMAAIDKGMVKSDIVVFRYENADITASWKPGEIHKREGFFSTSLKKAKAFKKENSAFLEIRVPAGTKAAYIGHQSIPGNERELLLQTGSSFKVVERKDKLLVLELVL